MRLFWLGALACFYSAAAFAQEPGAPRLETVTSTPAPEVEAPPAPPASDDLSDDVWRTYHLAFKALAAGRRAEAREMLEHITKAYGGHPAGKHATEILERLDRGETVIERPDVPPAATDDVLGRDTAPTAFSRAELVVFQTLHGIGIGGEICIAAHCDDARAVGAALTLGGGVGLATSLLLTGDGISPGHTAALNAGAAWGFGLTFMTMGIAQPDPEEVLFGALIGGQLAGIAAGELIWRQTHLSAGDVSLVSSVAIWSNVLTLFAFGMAEFDVEEEEVFATMLAVSALGLSGGALLADRFPMTRGHVLVIDGGGIIGGLMGVGIDLLLQGDDVEPGPLFALAGVGTIGGLALTAYLTRNWDVPDSSLMATFVPYEGGGMLMVGSAF